MNRLKLLAFATAAAAGGLALTAAVEPSVLTKASPGEWELSGVPGSRTPVRECLANLRALAQYEHRGRICTSQVISDKGTSTVIQYSCGSAGFGRTQIDVLTPRSLRISTQGISDNMPFNYVLQARRMGDCRPTASRH
jgi:hypothetical protein